MCAHNVATGPNVSQMGAFVHHLCNFGEKKGVLDSEIYSMLIVASCLKQDELFLTTQTVIPVFLYCRKYAPLQPQRNFRTI